MSALAGSRTSACCVLLHPPASPPVRPPSAVARNHRRLIIGESFPPGQAVAAYAYSSCSVALRLQLFWSRNAGSAGGGCAVLRELGKGLIKNRVLPVERPITDIPSGAGACAEFSRVEPSAE